MWQNPVSFRWQYQRRIIPQRYDERKGERRESEPVACRNGVVRKIPGQMLKNRHILLQNVPICQREWLPIYGIGALGIYALKPLKKHPALLFLLCVTVAGVVEYIIGYAGIHFFGLRLWDYRELFLNIDGIICFRSVVSFGILGLAFHYLVEPIGEKLYSRLPDTNYILINDCSNSGILIYFLF